jgi:hypothetical protein
VPVLKIEERMNKVIEIGEVFTGKKMNF